MSFINTVLGVPLGYVMYACYWLLSSYGWAILLFSVLVKIIFFPLNVVAQKNSIRLLKLQPAMDDINLRYAGDKAQISEAQYELFKKEKYSPLKGTLPLLIQLVLIIGVLQVMYNPLQHILHLDADIIQALTAAMQQITGTSAGAGTQLRIIEAVQQPALFSAFSEAFAHLPGAQEALMQIRSIDLSFWGMNLGHVPSLANPSALLFIPAASAISSFLLCVLQNALSPATQRQSAVGKWSYTAFLVALSLYFTLVFPAGVGIYWVASNLLAIVVALILNVMYNPKKLAPVAAPPIKKKLTPEEKLQQKQTDKALSVREKADMARFMATEKQLVFYSISSGQYKYFKTTIDYLLQHSRLVIHYLTNDPDDAVFKMDNARILPYYVGQSKTVSLMMKMEADMVVMTVPELQKYHIKRSVVKKDIEYLYIFHGISSYHLTLREGALDHYDTVFCTGPFTVEETRATELLYGTPAKRLVKFGASHLDLLMEYYAELPPKTDSRPQVLIAPSWQVDNLMDLCLDEVVQPLLNRGYRLILRPHPEYIKRFPQKMEAIQERYAHLPEEEFSFDLDFLSSDTIYRSDVLITDWSTIAFEFSFCTKCPCVFVNTPPKIMNPNYLKLNVETVDLTFRDILGKSIDIENLAETGDVVGDMLTHKDSYHQEIQKAMEHYLYYPGRSGEAGGKYIISRLESEKAAIEPDAGV